MRLLSRYSAGLLLAMFSVYAAAQEHHATVSFTLDFPGANSSHYEITIGDDGKGSYSSNGQLNQQSEPADAAPLLFTLSDNIRSQLFDLGNRTRYFSGK